MKPNTKMLARLLSRFQLIQPDNSSRHRLLSTACCHFQKTETTKDDVDKKLYMKAWAIHSYDGLADLQLTKRSPVPMITSPNEVLVQVHAASVNPIDIAMTNGYGAEVFNRMRNLEFGPGGLPDLRTLVKNNRIDFPLTLGRDFAGIVVAVGHGVDRGNVNVGDRVYGVSGIQRSGTHAEFAVVDSEMVRKIPKNLTFVEAASLPYVGITAWSAIRLTGSFVNLYQRRFLILGGSGGVGTIAIQFLKAHGANVTATGSSDAINLLESVGSDVVVDYKHDDYIANIGEHSPYDCILDLTGPNVHENVTKMTRFLKPVWGQYITLSPPFLANIDRYGLCAGMVKNVSELLSSNITSFSSDRVPVKWAFFVPTGSAMDELTDLVNRGRVKAVVQETFSFENLQNAYLTLKEGHARGKIVIELKKPNDNVK